MSNSSLKEQLQAVAAQLSDTLGKEEKVKQKPRPAQQPHHPTHLQKTKKIKPKWLDYVQYGVDLLKAYFPECFKSANEVKPLKKGIKQDLVLRLSKMGDIVTDDKACMTKSLSFYVNTIAYHKSVVEGADRIDLDGQAAGKVTLEEAKYSQDRNVEKMKQRQQQADSKQS